MYSGGGIFNAGVLFFFFFESSFITRVAKQSRVTSTTSKVANYDYAMSVLLIKMSHSGRHIRGRFPYGCRSCEWGRERGEPPVVTAHESRPGV
jgi:hypothetical protein